MSKKSSFIPSLAGGRLSSDISSAAESAVVKAINKNIENKYRGARRKLVGLVREKLHENAPGWAQENRIFLSDRLKSETRDMGHPKVGRGLNVRFRGNSLEVNLYTIDAEQKFGHNDYWMYHTAMYGREPRYASSPDKPLALPSPPDVRKRGPKGWANPLFVMSVSGVFVEAGWPEQAVQEVAEELKDL